LRFFWRRSPHTAKVIAHLVNTNSQYNLPPFGKKLIYAKNRQALNVPARFADPSVRQSVSSDVHLIEIRRSAWSFLQPAGWFNLSCG
jgi:hypothetical protein